MRRSEPQLFHRIADAARVAQVDKLALQALDRLRDVAAPDRGRDHLLDVVDVEAEPRGLTPLDVNPDVAAGDDALGERRARSRHPFHDPLDVAAEVFDDPEVRGPAILIPTGVLIPVASISMRVLIGMTQTLASPGNYKRRLSSP